MAQRKVRKPIRQGDIDGLCGVYASINAILRHHPALDDYDRQCKLFKAVVGPVYDTCKIVDGAEVDSVHHVLDRFKCELSREVNVETLCYPHIDKSKSFESWIRSISFNPAYESLIFGFEGKDSHWSVISSISHHHVNLFDSYTYRKFYLHDFVWAPSDDKTKIIVDPKDLIKVSVHKKR